MNTTEYDVLSSADQGNGSIGVHICLYKWHRIYFFVYGIGTSSLLARS